jgi:2',3'-cyclic-nucleotide 2'-phosphodiesterase/3'-nucleotidase
MYKNIIKKYAEYLLIFFIFIVSSCANTKPKDGFYHFEIFATNDLHGRLFDSLYTESARNQYSLSSVSTFITEARKTVGENSVILLDIGDHLQGDNSVFYYNYIDTNEVHIFSKVVNFLKYDAVVVGNHDIEAGHPVYDKINKELKPPYLAANAIDIELNKPYFKPYTIIEREGIRIAVIGMTNPNIKKWLSPDLWRGLSFEEIIPSLENIVKEIREKEAPHLIVAAIHAGLGDEDEYEMENPAKYVAKHVKGIDIVFAAHDHKTFIGKLYNGLDSVLILEGGSRASSLSCANIDIEIKDGLIVSKRLTPENISM